MRRLAPGCVGLLLVLACKGRVGPGPTGAEDAAPRPIIACFAAGTRVATPAGEAAIETLRPGDAVLSFDVERQRVVPGVVTAVRSHLDRLTGRLVAGERVLRVTAEHPIFLPARGAFVPAGSPLLSLAGAGTARVALAGAFAVPAGARPETVYDLTVAGQHDYFAEGILVHNKEPPRCPGESYGLPCESPPVSPCELALPRRTVDAAEAAARLGRWLWNDDGSAAVALAASAGLDATTRAGRDKLLGMLLEDPRAAAGFDAFLASWLGLPEDPPTDLVPPELWSSFREENRRFLWNVLMEKHGTLADVLESPETVVDERLAAHYGLPPVTGWTRVMLEPHGGVLGKGALLAAAHTGPLRGQYIYEHLYQCGPFPSVLGISIHPDRSLKTPARAAVVAAQGTDDRCKGCHTILDGPGFALQGYDELGRSRTVDSDGAPIDDRGWLVGGSTDRKEVSGRAELARTLAETSDAQACFLLQVATHALDRSGLSGFNRAPAVCLTQALPSEGFGRVIQGVASTLILDWTRPDGGAPDAAQDAVPDAAPDAAAD